MASKSVTFAEVAPTSPDVGVRALPTGRAGEAALVARVLAGDLGAHRELMAAHRDHVHHTLFRIMGSNREMEDLMQDTFIEVFRSLPSYRGESSLRRWCATIATRTAWRLLDRQQRTPRPIADVDLPDLASSTSDRLDAARACARLYAILDRMDPRLRITFALAVIDGRSMADVAAETGVSVMAVKTRLWRARAHVFRRARQEPALAQYLGELGELGEVAR